MKSMSYFTAAAIALACATASAHETSNWGLVNASYTVGASQLVAKDQGSLEMNLSLTCVERAADVQVGINELVGRLNQEVTRESKYTLVSLNPEITVSSLNRYEVQYDEKDVNRLNPRYVDVCNGNAQVPIGSGAIDLTKKVFAASATVKIETKEALAGLTILRQKLQQFAEGLNKENAAKQLTIDREIIEVSADRRREVVASLNEQTRLVGDLAKDTRLKVDQAIYGGFTELYITSVSTDVDGYPEYTSYAPELTENGKSKVTVPYTFSVQYKPKNLASNKNAAFPLSDLGQMDQQIDGVVVVDTDYYVAHLAFNTICQPSKKAASEAMAESYAHFKELAQSVVRASPNNPYERLEERIGSPVKDGQWQPWTKEIIHSTQPNRGDQVVVKSYISLCDGSIIPQVKEANQTYAATHTLTIVTNNFAGLKKIADAANEYTQEQRDSGASRRVEVQLGRIEPKLKDATHFEVVDVLAYRSALSQFVAPHGEVAKKLLDEIQAGEAYFTAVRGYHQQSQQRMERAGPPPPMARAAAGPAPSYKVVITSDGNIPMTEIRVNNTYTVVYRPVKDLIQILKDGRGSVMQVPLR
jgi:hypothetical protein